MSHTLGECYLSSRMTEPRIESFSSLINSLLRKRRRTERPVIVHRQHGKTFKSLRTDINEIVEGPKEIKKVLVTYSVTVAQQMAPTSANGWNRRKARSRGYYRKANSRGDFGYRNHVVFHNSVSPNAHRTREQPARIVSEAPIVSNDGLTSTYNLSLAATLRSRTTASPDPSPPGFQSRARTPQCSHPLVESNRLLPASPWRAPIAGQAHQHRKTSV